MNTDAGWYAVAISEGLEPGTSAGTRLFGKEIVVWRDNAKVAHAWEDRCPHRGMRLSFGFVRGERIACLYHGWQYDGDGRCRYIPAHPDLQVPASIRTTAYPCCERLGMLWVYSDFEAAEPPDPPPERSQVTPVRSIYFDCGSDALLACVERDDLPAFSSGGVSRPSMQETGSLLSWRFDHAELLAAVQPLSENKSALHIVVCAENWRGSGQKRISLWAEELRRYLHCRAAVGSDRAMVQVT